MALLNRVGTVCTSAANKVIHLTQLCVDLNCSNFFICVEINALQATTFAVQLTASSSFDRIAEFNSE